MTDAAYNAKNWLMRYEDLEEERIKAAGHVMMLRAKVNNCVSSYEYTGHRDQIGARAAHEDLLADYSEACDRLEAITEQVLHEDNITIIVLGRMKNKLYAAFLFDRFVNRIKMNEILKTHRYELKKSQLYRTQAAALDALGQILETRPPEIASSSKEQELEIIPGQQLQAPA